MDSTWQPGDLPSIDEDGLEPELELVGAAVRRALVRPLDPAMAEAHVRLMVAARHEARRVRRASPAGRRAGVGERHRWWPAAVAAAASVVAIAALAGGLPDPVQSRLAAAAAGIGISIPGRHDDGTNRISTPVPTVGSTAVAPTSAPPTESTTSVPPPPAPPSTEAPPPVPPPTSLASGTATRETATTVRGPAGPAGGPAATPTSPPSSEPSTSSPATTTPGAPACVDPVLVSVSATLLAGGTAVSVVIHTTGTVPYMSATVAGMTGLIVNLQPTADGFAGTITAPAPLPAGAVVEIGSCAHRIHGTAVIQR